jgi:hypothetical protein
VFHEGVPLVDTIGLTRRFACENWLRGYLRERVADTATNEEVEARWAATRLPEMDVAEVTLVRR